MDQGFNLFVSRTRTRTRAQAAAVVALLVVAVLFVSTRAHATIVERVVAIVGDHPILLSELRQRARPHLFRIAMQTRDPSQQAAAESKMFAELLNRMVEERLEEHAADKAHVSVTTEEVERGIARVAAQLKMNPTQLIGEARREGLSEQDYRDEIRRQVLESKLTELRVRGRVQVTESDGQMAYTRFVREMQAESPVDLRILVLQVPPGTSPAAREVLAEELVRRARAGEDFCELVLTYSEDPQTKNNCGSNGPLPMKALFPQLQRVALEHKPGEVADPIPFHDPMSGNQAVLVVQLAKSQPTIPPYAKVRDKMMERAFLEATERQRKQWLSELRRGVFIEVRL